MSCAGLVGILQPANPRIYAKSRLASKTGNRKPGDKTGKTPQKDPNFKKPCFMISKSPSVSSKLSERFLAKCVMQRSMTSNNTASRSTNIAIIIAIPSRLEQNLKPTWS